EDVEPAGIQIAREWTQETPEDDPEPANIIQILQGLIKAAKRCKTKEAIKALMPLTGLVHFVKLRDSYRLHPKCHTPAMTASLIAARRLVRGPYFARQLRKLELYVLKYRKLPPSKSRTIVEQQSLLNNENIIHNLRSYLAILKIGEVTPHKFMQHINLIVLPSLGFTGPKVTISEVTAYRWLGKLGYQNKEAKKGLFIDGHERADVIQSRMRYIAKIREYQSFMPIIDNNTLEITNPFLPSGCTLMIAVHHDEMSVATNEQHRRVWVKEGQQPLRKKGNGRSIHVSDFILETTGRLALTLKQLEAQKRLPLQRQLKITDARVIIHPGKNGDAWWDCSQLMEQIKNAIPIFEFLHPNAIGIWIFDCSSAHEAFAENSLNVKNMNINPGGKQRCLHPTTIPLNNPPPLAGEEDTRGKPQLMVYGNDHPDPKLRGKPKGIKVILQERISVWRELVKAAGGNLTKVIGICKICKASQVERDASIRIAAQEQADGDVSIDDGTSNVLESSNNTCCMTRSLSQQQDFFDEKPRIQTYIEEKGHICLFLPKFHPELDPIEMYWGWTKHQYRAVSDQKFSTAKALIPKILDSVDVKLIRKFFRKTWRYLDAYEKGLDAQQAAFAVKIYKSHRRIGTVREVVEEMKKKSKDIDSILQLI
ncbi:hypothetical protein M422DRAFT_169388, partial [Sphaerobolus stellatus SS14]